MKYYVFSFVDLSCKGESKEYFKRVDEFDLKEEIEELIEKFNCDKNNTRVDVFEYKTSYYSDDLIKDLL